MKDSFTVFYSWQTSTPENENKQLILDQLNTAANKLKKDGINLLIDQDSRNTTRKDSIDYIILQKIPSCDFFIGDITPILTNESGKIISNPNVMLELGYAVKVIGWARCILVWNSKFGDVNNAPFDIRNRSIMIYNSEKSNSIGFYDVLKDKINRYEQILAEQQNQEIDYNVFQHWNKLIPPQKLSDIINKIMTNCAYSTEDFNLLDDFQAEFSTELANHYKNNSLENGRKELNDSLRNFCYYLSGSEFDRADKYGINCNYWKMNANYTQYDPTKESEIINRVRELGNDVVEKNKQYFDMLQSVFGYLG